MLYEIAISLSKHGSRNSRASILGILRQDMPSCLRSGKWSLEDGGIEKGTADQSARVILPEAVSG